MGRIVGNAAQILSRIFGNTAHGYFIVRMGTMHSATLMVFTRWAANWPTRPQCLQTPPERAADRCGEGSAKAMFTANSRAKLASSPYAACASSYQSRSKKQLAAHARIRQHLTAQRHLLARLDGKAAAAEKRLGIQAHVGPQPDHARLLRRTVNLRHQRPVHTAPGMFACHKKRVDVARRLQVGKACNAVVPFGHPWAIGVQTLVPLRSVVFRWRPGLQLGGVVVLAG